MQEMKRKFRQLDEATRKLISKKLKGRKMSESHKVAISKGMKNIGQIYPINHLIIS